MSILEQRLITIGSTRPTRLFPALTHGQIAIVRNTGAPPIWCGRQTDVAPRNGMPLLPGEVLRSDDHGGGGIWGIIEPTTSDLIAGTSVISGQVACVVSDSFAVDIFPGVAGDAFLGNYAIPSAAGAFNLFANLPVSGWDSLVVTGGAGTSQQSVLIRALWGFFDPTRQQVIYPGAGILARSQHTVAPPPGQSVAIGGFRDVWPNLGDYLTLQIATVGTAPILGSGVQCWLTKRTTSRGYPPTENSHGDGRLFIANAVLLGPGNQDQQLAAYSGRATLFLTGPGGQGGVEIRARPYDQAAPGEILVQFFPTATPLTIDVDLPPLINTLRLANPSGGNLSFTVALVAHGYRDA